MTGGKENRRKNDKVDVTIKNRLLCCIRLLTAYQQDQHHKESVTWRGGERGVVKNCYLKREVLSEWLQG